MTTVASQQTSTVQRKEFQSPSPSSLIGFLPAWAFSAPCQCGVVCFLSGTIGSAIISLVVPTDLEDSDIRSFSSFAIGAVMCCVFMNKFSIKKTTKVANVTATPRQRMDALSKVMSQAPSLKQGSDKVMPPPCLGAQCKGAFAAPPGLTPPPGLAGSAATPPWRQRSSTTATKAPAPQPTISATPPPYAPQTFRKDIMAIMKELASHRNVAIAVGQVRARDVPVDRHSAEFADILTYALEEARGTVRRTYIAFIAGLTGAFDKNECIAGVKIFFGSVYDDLSEEVPKLEKLVRTELVPTLHSVLSAEQVGACVPKALN